MVDLPLRSSRGAVEGAPLRREEAPPEPPPHPRRGRRRGRWRLPLLLLLLLLLTAGAAYLLLRPAPAHLALSPAAVDFGEQRYGGASEPIEVAVANTGGQPLRITELELIGEAAAEFEILSETCTGTVRAAGEICNLRLHFRPAGDGRREASLAIRGNADARLPLRGIGSAPLLAADRVEVDFGPQPVDGRSASRDLSLSNRGSAPLTISGLELGGEAPGDFSLVERCSEEGIPAGGSCTVRITFTPLAAGERSAELRVESDAVEALPPLRVAGTGILAGPSIATAPEALDFGAQRVGRKSEVRVVRVTNRAQEPVSIVDVGLDDAGAGFAIQAEDCRGAAVAPAEGCRVSVTFTPSADGRATATLSVRDSLQGSTQVALAGNGVSPRLRPETLLVDFGGIRAGFESAPRSATLRNSGSAPLAIRRSVISGAGRSSFAIQRDGCTGSTLQPGGRCSIDLLFQPRGAGSLRAELRIESDDARGEQAIALAGSGTAAELEVDRSRLEYGTVQRPASASRELTLTNRGTARLLIGGLRIGGPAAEDFRVLRTDCREEGLRPGASCTVTVLFVPASDGARSARLEIRHDGADEPQEVLLLGTALAAQPAFRVSERAIRFGTRQVGSRTEVRTLRIENAGSGRLELGSIRLAGAHAGDFQLVAGTCDGAPFVAPRSDCTVGIRFVPQAPGQRRATLTIRHNAGRGRDTVSLEGTGVSPVRERTPP